MGSKCTGNRMLFLVLVLCATTLILQSKYLHEKITNRYATPTDIVSTSNKKDKATITGKTKVYRHNGTGFERLHEFCTWTQPFHCSPLKTPVGPIPIFHHDPNTDFYMSRTLVTHGQRDGKEINIIMQELEKYPEATFLDIGANIGIYTLTIARTLRRKVIAVEPVIQNAARLCKSVQENGLTDSVTLVFNPLSDKHELVAMMKPKTHLSASKVMKHNTFRKSKKILCSDVERYQTTTLDDILPLMSAKQAVIKLDVESYEYHVINGGQHFLDEIKVSLIFMEWFHVKKSSNARRLVKMMGKRNYVPNNLNGHILDQREFLKWPFNVVWRKKEI